ncbi:MULTISPECIES: sugar ABC transporter permease [unclassified Haladaptatus]|uniref:carbohydrate ABC transporter permease n=1 Tax=unclassified Haladaptatus TaxID=2622732 RepID=UPI00209C3725|nr:MULTISPECIES: sugar ABC transporter permease [unclassified Haladaptatus]MCO8244878.1 sugar ABC transporter permease [Haladaptatus sp. AB643]MCO8255609.1 sugar ABC transporter permease [Haladaptatus sp. AB618]
MSVESKQFSERVHRLFIDVTDRLEPIQNTPLTWIIPAVLFLLTFRLYPLLEAIRMSFTNMNLIQPSYHYVGFEAFTRVVSAPSFWTMARVTVIFVAISVVLQIVLGMILALAINHGVKKHLYGSVTTRVAVLSAWVIPGIVIGILWKIMLIETNYGIVNYFLVQSGFHVVSFLSDPQIALLSTIAANTWRGTAFSMIMLYAGLQQVPQHLYDAARVDGAGPLERFRYVTLPQIKPVVFINLVLITIYTLNTFDMIMSLTGGGPGHATEVLALFMYDEGFKQFNLGQAAAVAVMMLAVNVVMTVIYMRLFINEEEF